MGNEQPLYDRDFYAWANEQAGLLRAGRLSEVAIERIAEEIESIGKSEKRELVSCLSVLLVHLLKWQHQSVFRSTSWRLTIKEQRAKLEGHLGDNPSLKSMVPAMITTAYAMSFLVRPRKQTLSPTYSPQPVPGRSSK